MTDNDNSNKASFAKKGVRVVSDHLEEKGSRVVSQARADRANPPTSSGPVAPKNTTDDKK